MIAGKSKVILLFTQFAVNRKKKNERADLKWTGYKKNHLTQALSQLKAEMWKCFRKKKTLIRFNSYNIYETKLFKSDLLVCVHSLIVQIIPSFYSISDYHDRQQSISWMKWQDKKIRIGNKTIFLIHVGCFCTFNFLFFSIMHTYVCLSIIHTYDMVLFCLRSSRL